jgi:toxin-antitoxin system PIN domain toxin
VEVGLVDANLLIYAYNETALQHAAAKRWLSHVLSAPAPLYLPWTSIQAFLRIITNERLFDPPLTPEQATNAVDSWLGAPNIHIIEPGLLYWTILRDLILKHDVRGSLVSDAHLAALAIEHDATLYTADSDFRRFSGLRVINPLRV